ncbi:MAG TPA: TraM recognition domain-containing protein [Streptosporangiaceae bacterium]|jgi:type IV secretory pathway TraG/TraD family ATPase VirD4
MTRAIGPRPSMTAGSAFTGWLAIAACWSAVGALGLLWCAARLAAAFTGGKVRPFGSAFVRALLQQHAWTGVPTAWVLTITAVFLAAVATAGALAWARAVRYRRPVDDPAAALAHNPRLHALADRAPADAVRLRRTLRGSQPRDVGPHDLGLVLGHLPEPGHRRTGRTVYASWEDTVLAFMGPRTGKTTTFTVPAVLSAPGPVIATSNKADLWAATAAIREDETGGEIWLFDPQAVTYQPQRWWWNPLLHLTTVEDADRLAGHFVLTVADERQRDLWGPAAQDLLAALLLAAAHTGRSLRDVTQWLTEPGVPTPCELLDSAGFRAMAASLRGAQNGAVETRDGIYQTARTAAKCLNDEAIMAWVTPGDLPEFDPGAFADSVDTLYLLSKSRSAAAPLIAALTDATMRAAERRAEQAGGRLDPPLPVILDEAANICRIADLPDLYSHLGSRGIVPVTILQSYEQGTTVWGEAGMAALWGAATKKLIGAGCDSPRLARDLSSLIGQHDVPVRGVTYQDGRPGENISLRRQEILDPAQIRALAPGTAVLLATGVKPALIDLKPWLNGPDAARIAACARDAETAITNAARRIQAAGGGTP